MTSWLHSLSLVAVVAYAVLAGVFLAFSDFLMRALAVSEDGAHVMQAINREVFRIVFMALFLAMVPISLALTFGAWASDRAAGLVGAGLVYLIGCFAVTAAGNVPMNKTLARIDPSTPDGAEYWRKTYLPRWTRLNTLRTLACLLASGLTLATVVSN